MPDNPNPPAAALLQLAARAMAAQDFPTAEAHLNAVLLHDPTNPTALHHLALRAWLRGQHADARSLLERALHAAPDDPAVLTSFATMLHEVGEPAPALDLFLRLLAIDSAQPDIWNAAGICLQETAQQARAIEFYLRALQLRPTFPEALSNLAAVLTAEGDPTAAIDHLRQALALDPTLADAHHNLGIALRARFEYAAAITSLRRALTLRPNNPETLASLGELLSLTDDPAAEPLLRQAVQLRPTDPDKHWNLALELLKRGDFPNGWREYEWRWRRTKHQTPPRPYPQPLWLGDPTDLRNQTLLLHAEQGFGDTIQFLRFLPAVLALGPRILLEVPGPLLRLATTFAAQLSPNITVLPEGSPLPAFDLHTPLMSLPLALNLTLDTIPPPIRLTPAPTTKPAAKPLRIGLAWAGNPRHNRDRERSIPTACLLPLLNTPNCTFVSLQIGPPAAELAHLAPHIEHPPLNDFLDTALILDTLDLVLTVDSAVAHLAATQAIPTWLLLPYVAEWRWHMPPFNPTGSTGNPWYPHIRIFRQRTLPDGRPQTDLWPPLIAEAIQALQSLANGIEANAIP